MDERDGRYAAARKLRAPAGQPPAGRTASASAVAPSSSYVALSQLRYKSSFLAGNITRIQASSRGASASNSRQGSRQASPDRALEDATPVASLHSAASAPQASRTASGSSILAADPYRTKLSDARSMSRQLSGPTFAANTLWPEPRAAAPRPAISAPAARARGPMMRAGIPTAATNTTSLLTSQLIEGIRSTLRADPARGASPPAAAPPAAHLDPLSTAFDSEGSSSPPGAQRFAPLAPPAALLASRFEPLPDSPQQPPANVAPVSPSQRGVYTYRAAAPRPAEHAGWSPLDGRVGVAPTAAVAYAPLPSSQSHAAYGGADAGTYRASPASAGVAGVRVLSPALSPAAAPSAVSAALRVTPLTTWVAPSSLATSSAAPLDSWASPVTAPMATPSATAAGRATPASHHISVGTPSPGASPYSHSSVPPGMYRTRGS